MSTRSWPMVMHRILMCDICHQEVGRLLHDQCGDAEHPIVCPTCWQRLDKLGLIIIPKEGTD